MGLLTTTQQQATRSHPNMQTSRHTRRTGSTCALYVAVWYGTVHAREHARVQDPNYYYYLPGHIHAQAHTHTSCDSTAYFLSSGNVCFKKSALFETSKTRLRRVALRCVRRASAPCPAILRPCRTSVGLMGCWKAVRQTNTTFSTPPILPICGNWRTPGPF